MDAEKLSEIGTHSGSSAVSDMAPGPLRRYGSALGIVDALLSLPGTVSGEEADLLLDLRHLLKEHRHAEQALRVFCDLRRRLEKREYLLFYRLRRWLEQHIVVEVGPSHRLPTCKGTVQVPLQLRGYCVEALRRHNLCLALRLHPSGRHLKFRFHRPS